MIPYFFVTVPIAVMAALTPMYRRQQLLWLLAFLTVVVFVGLRHHVGMDWNNYLIMIERANVGGLIESFDVAEPGYATLLWIAGQYGWGIYGAYFAGTLIFASGLFRYASTTPAPWLALVVAMPFLVIVVAMSAARQAVAIGVLLWLMAEWQRASVLKRTLLIAFATTFHISAAAFFVFVFLDLRLQLWARVVGTVMMSTLLLYVLQISGRAEYYDSVYVSGQTGETQSSGALFHVLLNGGPAIIAFLLGKRARGVLLRGRVETQMAIGAILLVPLALVTSAAAGRMTLYLFPVSMGIIASMPLLFQDGTIRLGFKTVASSFFVLLLATWLNAGNASVAHQNYRNALFIPDFQLVLCCN